MKQKEVFVKAGILLLLLLLMLGLVGCGGTSGPMSTQTPATTPTSVIMPTPISTPTPTLPPAPPEEVMYLQVPESATSLWGQWNGRYVIYAHRSAGIETLDDLDGKVLLIAFMEVEANDILGDAQQFVEACGISMTFAIQNNPNTYNDNLLEDSNRVGFMVSDVADYYGFDENQDLIRIEFQK